MTGDPLDRIDAMVDAEVDGGGMVTVFADDVLALVQVARAARATVSGMTELPGLPGCIGTIRSDQIDDLHAALARLEGTPE
jgi:hypothetical protein